MKNNKLFNDLNKKDLLKIFYFILPELKDKIKNIKRDDKTNTWGEEYIINFKKDKEIVSIYIDTIVTRHQDAGFKETISEAINITNNWDIEIRKDKYFGESYMTSHYRTEWFIPKNILKTYKFIESLGYIVE